MNISLIILNDGEPLENVKLILYIFKLNEHIKFYEEIAVLRKENNIFDKGWYVKISKDFNMLFSAFKITRNSDFYLKAIITGNVISNNQKVYQVYNYSKKSIILKQILSR